MHFLILLCTFLHFYLFLEFCFIGVAEILHPLHLFPNPSMARTHGVHSFRPRVRPSSPPLVAGQSTPPAAAAAASHAPVPIASAPRKYDTWVGPTPPSLAHPRPSHRARASHLVGGLRSPIRHLFMGKLMTSHGSVSYFYYSASLLPLQPHYNQFRLQYQGSALQDIL